MYTDRSTTVRIDCRPFSGDSMYSKISGRKNCSTPAPRLSPTVGCLEFAVEEAVDSAVSKPVSKLSDEIDTKMDESDRLKDRNERPQRRSQVLRRSRRSSRGRRDSHDTVQRFQRPLTSTASNSPTTTKNSRSSSRRESGEVVGIDEMSSGQRTALVLANTNNLAHDSAPPLMLTDEPFAH